MEFVNHETGFYMTAMLMFLSRAVVYLWMVETLPDFGRMNRRPLLVNRLSKESPDRNRR